MDISQLPPLLQGVVRELVKDAEKFEDCPYGTLTVDWTDNEVRWINVLNKRKVK